MKIYYCKSSDSLMLVHKKNHFAELVVFIHSLIGMKLIVIMNLLDHYNGNSCS